MLVVRQFEMSTCQVTLAALKGGAFALLGLKFSLP